MFWCSLFGPGFLSTFSLMFSLALILFFIVLLLTFNLAPVFFRIFRVVSLPVPSCPVRFNGNELNELRRFQRYFLNKRPRHQMQPE